MLSRFSRVRLCATPWTVGHQVPLSTGFSRQEYWWVAISFSRTGILSSPLYPWYKPWDRGLAGHLLIGWGTYSLWGKSKANTFFLCAVGETGYTAQENLKSVNSYNMGEGRMIRIWFFHSCIPRPPWFYLLFHPWVTTERDWNGETLRRQNLQHLVTLLGIEHQEELGCIPEPWLLPASPASVYSPFHPYPPPYWLSSC